jgi:hypothetical protein
MIRRFLIRIFCEFLILLSVSFFGLCVAEGMTREMGWILTQSADPFGDQYVYLSNEGVKCYNPARGIGWVATSPNWNVTLFNDQTKLYYPFSYKTFKNWIEQMRQHKLTSSDIHWSKIGSCSITGARATEYKASDTAVTSSVSCWFADDIKVPSSLAQLINSVCGLPASDSIPLQLYQYDRYGRPAALLKTYRQQQAVIPQQTFYLPRNYKLAKDQAEIALSKQNLAALRKAVNQNNGKTVSIDTNRLSSSGLSLNKIPEQITLSNGKTITKAQIKKEMEKFMK